MIHRVAASLLGLGLVALTMVPLSWAQICSSDSDCDDGVFCNGLETCQRRRPFATARFCGPGVPPCGESDTTCSEEQRRCVPICADGDSDGHPAASCGGDDCDDGDPGRFPGNVEACDADDEDCDLTTFGARDFDGDGFADAACCNETTCGTDCDDSRRAVNPNAAEICDGLDNDCNGERDEGTLLTVWADADGDTFGDPTQESQVCPHEVTPFLVTNPHDCNDTKITDNPVARGTLGCDPPPNPNP